MRVPLLDLQAQIETLEPALSEAVLEVVRSGRWVLGPKVEELEERIAGYVGSAHAIGVSSGSDALLVSLMALGIGPGDVVLTPDYSFFATAGAVSRLGATPAFLDIDPVTYNMTPEALAAWEDAYPERAERVKAVIVVHLFGQCADLGPLIEIAERRGWAIVEDAAQAIGATYPQGASTDAPTDASTDASTDAPAGEAGARTDETMLKAGAAGTLGCFSFYPTKNLGALGDAGMVVTNDADLADRVRTLRLHGSKPKYYHRMIGGNFRLDPIQAAALLVKLPHLEAWHAARREHAAYYDENLRAPGLSTPKAVYGRRHHIYNQYVIRVENRRDALRAFLAEQGVGSEVYYPVPFCAQDCFADLGHDQSEFPESVRAARETLAIPVYPELSRDQQDYVIDKIKEFCNG